MTDQFVEDYDPTIEDSYRKQVNIFGEDKMLEILDTAGEEEFCGVHDQCYRFGEAFVGVYSLTSKSSLADLDDLLARVHLVKDIAYGEETISVIVVGNKVDLSDQRMVSVEEGRALASKYKAGYIETSAKEGINVEETFTQLASHSFFGTPFADAPALALNVKKAR